MAFTPTELATIHRALDGFLAIRRPPPDMRHLLDLEARIQGQQVVLLEVRAAWQKPTEKIECPIAKASYIRNLDVWKVYWMRADLRWHRYEPDPQAKTIHEFLAIVQEDGCACFFG